MLKMMGSSSRRAVVTLLKTISLYKIEKINFKAKIRAAAVVGALPEKEFPKNTYNPLFYLIVPGGMIAAKPENCAYSVLFEFRNKQVSYFLRWGIVAVN